MKYRFFYINALDPDSGEQALNQFLNQHAVLSVDKHFMGNTDVAGWSFVVSYDDTTSAQRRTPTQARRSVDYREVLNEADFKRFSELRRLRKQVAEEQAVPPYTVFTNEQLAEMVRGAVTSLEGLAAIEGIGEARLQRYGELFLERLTALSQSSAEI